MIIINLIFFIYILLLYWTSSRIKQTLRDDPDVLILAHFMMIIPHLFILLSVSNAELYQTHFWRLRSQQQWGLFIPAAGCGWLRMTPHFHSKSLISGPQMRSSKLRISQLLSLLLLKERWVQHCVWTSSNSTVGGVLKGVVTHLWLVSNVNQPPLWHHSMCHFNKNMPFSLLICHRSKRTYLL